MKQNMRDSNSEGNRILGQLAADKKKAVMALCLIAVMVFMWVRVLGGKAPEATNAMPSTQKSGGGQSDSELKISFVELPKVEGRNDTLTRDFFTVGSWKDFTGEDAGEVNVVSGGSSEEVAREAANKLKLEAVVLGESPQAFINDKLLVVGDRLTIVDGVNEYEFEVVGIEEKTVLVRYGEVKIALRLREGQ